MNNHRLKLSLVLITFLISAVSLNSYADVSSNKTKSTECSKLSATGNPEYPPYLFKDSLNPNQLIGSNTQILKEIGKALNLEIEVVYSGPWSRAQEEVRAGRIDLLAGAFFTIPRAQYMDYIYPAFLNTRSVVWVDKDRRIKYSKKEDLISLKGVTVINNSFGQEFDTFAKDKLSISTVTSLKQAFRMIKLGRVDYLLYEESPATAYAASLRFEDQIEVIGPEISSEGLYLTLSHKSKCNTGTLRGKLTKALNEILKNNLEKEALETGLLMWNNQAINN
jgi:polar amino acid transport system substrate-binding protein